MNPQEPQHPPKPVAYDQNGNPLYAHPPKQRAAQNGDAPASHQVVQMMRPIEPAEPHISDTAKARHEESKKKYPGLNLSPGEFVISAIKRHPIGLVSIWLVAGSLIVLMFVAMAMIATPGALDVSFSQEGGAMLSLMLLMLTLLFFFGGVIATVVYNANRFYLTNESVIQHIQTSLFAKKEQIISLGNIEDASFRQTGIIQHILGYGSLRLSTEGDETTYRFSFVTNPRRQVHTLNDAVEAFKNGRPVADTNDD